MTAGARKQVQAVLSSESCDTGFKTVAELLNDGIVDLETRKPDEANPFVRPAFVSFGSTDKVTMTKRDGRWEPRRFFLLERSKGVVSAKQATHNVLAHASERRDGALVPCGSIDDSDPTQVSGGCVGRVDSGSIEISLSNVSGTWSLPACSIDFAIHVGSTGHNRLAGIRFDGNSCSDISPCSRDGDPLAWEGQFHPLASPNQVHNHVDACLETPLGRIEGPTSVYWTRRGETWSVDRRRTPVRLTPAFLEEDWDARFEGLRFHRVASHR